LNLSLLSGMCQQQQQPAWTSQSLASHLLAASLDSASTEWAS